MLFSDFSYVVLQEYNEECQLSIFNKLFSDRYKFIFKWIHPSELEGIRDYIYNNKQVMCIIFNEKF